jgi:hypothetical protein
MTALNIPILDFWFMTPCILVSHCRYIGITCSLHPLCRVKVKQLLGNDNTLHTKKLLGNDNTLNTKHL